ncbi:hypothetical protein [Paenibacillus sp. FSL L8-0463]|uniref:hypothetical protein n=1 Tax=Paenibacillus sp. FSL L8-0463 TaxID=2954687 RepID=UPI00311A1998
MTAEELLNVLMQYHELSRVSSWKAVLQYITYLAPLFTLISVFVAFNSVTRNYKNNVKIDIEKFKRETGVKAADELIETISEVKMKLGGTVVFREMWERFINEKITLDYLRGYIRDCSNEQYDSVLKMASQFKKRKIILSRYEENIEHIYTTGNALIDKLTLFDAFLSSPGLTDTEIAEIIIEIQIISEKLTDYSNELLIDIQQEYFGRYYELNIENNK